MLRAVCPSGIRVISTSEHFPYPPRYPAPLQLGRPALKRGRLDDTGDDVKALLILRVIRVLQK